MKSPAQIREKLNNAIVNIQAIQKYLTGKSSESIAGIGVECNKTAELLEYIIKNNHLKWKWLSFFNGPFYLILFALNIFYLSRFTYSLLCFIIIYLFFILSYILFNYHVGELWCFFGSSIPLLMLFFSYVIR
jgi:ABC-type multidrug transport system fused ATPase/permease subunit